MEAGRPYCNGHGNVSIGSSTGPTSGRANVIFGTNTATSMTGDNNFVVGEFASRKCAMSGDHNIVFGACAGCMMTSALNNIVLGVGAARGGVFTGNDNVVLGAQAASNFSGAACNIILGRDAAQNITTGQRNIIIGKNVDPPAADSDDTLAIGCNTSRWITGNSSFKVGISSNITSPRAELHVEGSIHATRFFQNPTALDTSESFPADGGAAVNGGVYGPYTINTGVTLTIGDGSTFTVV